MWAKPFGNGWGPWVPAVPRARSPRGKDARAEPVLQKEGCPEHRGQRAAAAVGAQTGDSSAPATPHVRRRPPTCASDPTSGRLPRGAKAGSRTDGRTPAFLAALFTIAQSWKSCPGTDNWVNHVIYLYDGRAYNWDSFLGHKMEGNSEPQATPWTDLENITRSKISQIQENKYRPIPRIRGT